MTDNWKLGAVINTRLSENVAMKFFATDISYDGYMDNITTGSGVGERDYQNYGLTFLFEPNDRFEALLTVEAFRDEGIMAAFQTNYNTPPGLLAAPPPGSPENDYSGGFLNCTVFGNCRNSLERPEFSDNDKDNLSELDTESLTLNMSYEINENLTLVSITGHRKLDEYRYYDFDASPNPFITIERKNDFEQTSQELRLDGNYDKVSFSAGVYYYNQDFTQDWSTADQFWAFLFGGVVADPGLYAACLAGAFTVACDEGLTSIPLGTEVAQVLYENQDTTSMAVYGQMDYRFNEKWTGTAGIRWTEEEKDFIAGQAYLTTKDREWLRNFPTAFGDNGYADLLEKWTDTSFKLGLTYNINDSSIVYGMFSQGFHSGGFFGVNQNIRDFIRDVYDPETADNYEIGYKSQHLDDRLRFNAVYFYNDFKDKQESFVALDPDTKTVATVFDNAASVKYKGVEIEAVFVFNEYFRGFINYGSLDAEYEEFFTDINPNDAQELIEDASFLTPRNAPEFTLGVGGTLSIPVETGVVEAFVKFTRIDEREASLLNLGNSRIDETDELSLSVGYYANENWAVSAYCRNCTDERFEVFSPIATLFAAGSVNKPRSYGLEFTYQF
ncbi:MAG: TonB-dependent receptor [Candidatus Azotimanducaceae bacterium]